jgi:hypothetical protein
MSDSAYHQSYDNHFGSDDTVHVKDVHEVDIEQTQSDAI